MKRFLICLLFFGIGLNAFAETMPPKPERYFNDYAGVTSSSTAAELNATLEEFERTTSSQIVVAIFKKMESESSIEDYTVRVAQSWRVGQKDKDNGAVLFIFVQNHTMYIQVGYGLEGALPDALCKDIIEDQIKPHLKDGDFDGGLKAGVAAMIAATKGEYKGTGRTVADSNRSSRDKGVHFAVTFGIIVFLILLFIKRSRGPRGYYYGGLGRRSYSSGWLGGGGGSSWGGGGGGSGGGFSGGGGSFGGGGAGGSW